MRISWSVALLGCGLLAGCQNPRAKDEATHEGTARTPEQQLSVTGDTSQGYRGPEAAPVTPVQGGTTLGGPLTATGNLIGIARDAPPGAVTLTEAGPGGTQVLIKIDRYTPGTKLAATLNAGSCGQPGAVVAQVGGPFEVESSGFATLQASVPQPTASLLDGRHSVRITNPGAVTPRTPPTFTFACADLPAVSR